MSELQIIIAAVAGIACFAFGYAWAGPRRMRKFKCWIGAHAPDSKINQEGQYLVQRCLYCDRVTMKMEVKGHNIRRVQ